MPVNRYPRSTCMTSLNSFDVTDASLSCTSQPMTSTPVKNRLTSHSSFDDVSSFAKTDLSCNDVTAIMKGNDAHMKAVFLSVIQDAIKEQLSGSILDQTTPSSLSVHTLQQTDTPQQTSKWRRQETPKSVRATLVRFITSSPSRFKHLLSQGRNYFPSPACLKDNSDVMTQNIRGDSKLKRPRLLKDGEDKENKRPRKLKRMTKQEKRLVTLSTRVLFLLSKI